MIDSVLIDGQWHLVSEIAAKLRALETCREALRHYASYDNWLTDDAGYLRLYAPGQHGNSVAIDALPEKQRKGSECSISTFGDGTNGRATRKSGSRATGEDSAATSSHAEK